MPIADAVLDAFEEALVVVDRTFVVIRWSSAMESLTAVDRSRALGRPVADVTTSLGRLDLAHHLGLAIAGQETRVDEAEHDPGTARRYLAARCVPLRDESGAVTGAAAFVSDVTERRRRAVFLRAIEAIGRSLTTSLDLDDVLDTIATRALEVMGAESALVASWDGRSPVFRIMRVVGRLSDAYAVGGVLPVGGGPGSRAVLESRAVTTSDMLADPAFVISPERRAQVEREGYKAVAAAPLVSKGRVHGALVVYYWRERTFTDEERSALVLLAEHAALAIDGAQLFGQATRRAQRLRELAEVGRLVTSSLELSEVLTRIARSTARLVGAPVAVVWTAEPEARVIHARARSVESGYPEDAAFPRTLEFGRGIGGRVAETRRRIFVADVTQDPRMVSRDWAVQAGLRTLLAVPIEAGEHLLGVLTVAGREGTLAAEEDQELVASLAALAGVALQNARAYAQAIRRAKRLGDLVAVSQSITASLDTKDVMERIAQAASAMTPGALASVHVHDAERDTLAFAATTDAALESFAHVHPAALGLPGLVVERRLPVLVTDPANHPRTSRPEWWRERPGATYYGVPIVAGEAFVGVLDYILPSGPPEREEQEALQLLAAQAGVAIRNAALYQAEREQAERTRTLAAINRRISGALDLDELLRMISEAAGQLTGTRFVFFWLADDATRTLSFRGGSVPEIARDFPESTRSYDVGASGWVARHRTPIDIRDVFADERMTLREWWVRWGLRSLSAYPVIGGGELLAVLSLSHAEPIELSRETREVLDLLIAQGSVAIQNARLYRAAERRRDVAEALARLGRDLTGTLDHARIAQLVAQGLVELLGSRDSAVYRLEPADGTLHVLAWSGADAELLRGVVLAPGEGVAGRAVAERRLVSSRDMLEDPAVLLSESLRARLAGFRHRAIVSAPLIARDQVIGALILADDDRQYAGEELQVLQTFADQAALALDNARLYASARDSLDRLRETQAQLVQAGKLSALGQLISGVAHELNNPLSVIIGYGQLLAGRQLPDNVRRPLEMIVQQGDRMAKIVHNLLYFSRQRPPERARLDLHAIIEQTLALRLNQLTLSGIVVDRELAPDLPMIVGDAQQLQQIFLNLLLNAEQAITGGSTGGGRIVFRTRAGDDGRVVRASVIDDGPGIAPETLPHVFEPFFTTKDVGAGTGLGLSVSYGIAQEHQGRLTVESRPGRTVFTLELPVGPPAETTDVDAVDHTPVPGRGRRALVVEDEPGVRDVVVDLLEESGWRVDTAGGGRAALAMATQTSYALIVCDIRMPDGGGEEFYRRAVAHERALGERFVFITGDTANPAAWSFLGRASVPVIEKPFLTGALLDAVRRVASRESY